MYTGATRGAGGAGLVVHLLKTAKGQEVELLPARGLLSPDLRGQVSELALLSAHGRTAKPVMMLFYSPNPKDRPPTDVEMDDLKRRTEEALGIERQPRAGVRHREKARDVPDVEKHPLWAVVGEFHDHEVYSLVRRDGRVADLSNDFIVRQRVNKQWEVAHGFELTPIKHERAVLAWLDQHDPATAAAMRAAGMDGRGPARVADRRPQDRHVEERTGIELVELQGRAYEAWKAAAGNPARLAAELEARGLGLAQGDKTPVCVDWSGTAHPLPRLVGAASKRDGERINAAAVKAVVAGLALDPLDAVRERVRALPTTTDPSHGHGRPGPDARAAAAAGGRPDAAGGPADAGAVGGRPAAAGADAQQHRAPAADAAAGARPADRPAAGRRAAAGGPDRQAGEPARGVGALPGVAAQQDGRAAQGAGAADPAAAARGLAAARLRHALTAHPDRLDAVRTAFDGPLHAAPGIDRNAVATGRLRSGLSRRDDGLRRAAETVGGALRAAPAADPRVVAAGRLRGRLARHDAALDAAAAVAGAVLAAAPRPDPNALAAGRLRAGLVARADRLDAARSMLNSPATMEPVRAADPVRTAEVVPIAARRGGSGAGQEAAPGDPRGRPSAAAAGGRAGGRGHGRDPDAVPVGRGAVGGRRPDRGIVVPDRAAAARAAGRLAAFSRGRGGADGRAVLREAAGRLDEQARRSRLHAALLLGGPARDAFLEDEAARLRERATGLRRALPRPAPTAGEDAAARAVDVAERRLAAAEGRLERLRQAEPTGLLALFTHPGWQRKVERLEGVVGKAETSLGDAREALSTLVGARLEAEAAVAQEEQRAARTAAALERTARALDARDEPTIAAVLAQDYRGSMAASLTWERAVQATEALRSAPPAAPEDARARAPSAPVPRHVSARVARPLGAGGGAGGGGASTPATIRGDEDTKTKLDKWSAAYEGGMRPR